MIFRNTISGTTIKVTDPLESQGPKERDPSKKELTPSVKERKTVQIIKNTHMTSDTYVGTSLGPRQ